jgi:outer membrane receptor protein involved in Fe transport
LNGGYQTKGWSVTAGVKNLADRRNYSLNSGQFGRGTINQTREFYVSGRYSFF